MSQNRVLVLVAGAAMGLSGVAFGQNANLDTNRAYAAELLADSGGRASLLAQPGTNGWQDGRFTIGDGTNTLSVGGTIQSRYNISLRDEDTAGENEDFTHGFGYGSVRLRAFGSIWDRNLTYKIQGNFNGTGEDNGDGGFVDNDGTFGLEDAWGRYQFDNGVSVRWGQFRLPLFREVYGVDDEYQLAVDRSINSTSAFFSQGYSQGVEVGYQSDSFRVFGAFSDGLSSANTAFNGAGESDYAGTARLEFQVMGTDWQRWNDFTSWQSAADTGILLGAAVHYESSGETGGTGADEGEIFIGTIDASFEGQGWNIFAAGNWFRNDDDVADASDNFGAVLQGGIFVTPQAELFARYDGIFFDDDAFGDIDDAHFATAGVNYYISPESHAVKFTAEVGYSFTESAVLFGGGDTRAGFLGDTEDGEIIFQSQLQVLF